MVVHPASLSSLILAAAVGCASSGRAVPSAMPQGSSADLHALGPGLLQWTGRFQPIQQQTGDGTAVRGRNRVNGSVRLVSNASGRMDASISVSTPLTTATNVRWALASGACGSGALPVLPVDQFPEISVSGGGRGDMHAEVPTPLPTTGSYHVNVYWSNGQDEGDVMSCANLRLEQRKGP